MIARLGLSLSLEMMMLDESEYGGIDNKIQIHSINVLISLVNSCTG
jgi:hypothetical protein